MTITAKTVIDCATAAIGRTLTDKEMRRLARALVQGETQNQLTLTIINDRMAYPTRLQIARQNNSAWRFRRWASQVWFAATDLTRYEGTPPTVAELCQVVAELEEYYRDHVAEIDRIAAEDKEAAP